MEREDRPSDEDRKHSQRLRGDVQREAAQRGGQEGVPDGQQCCRGGGFSLEGGRAGGP